MQDRGCIDIGGRGMGLGGNIIDRLLLIFHFSCGQSITGLLLVNKQINRKSYKDLWMTVSNELRVRINPILCT